MKTSLTLALCLGMCLTAATLQAEHEGKGKKHDSTAMKSQCHAKDLIGARVSDAQGQKVGEIEDLVIEPPSGRVQFAVVRLDRDLAKGKAYTPIPMTALRPDTARDRAFMLTFDRDKLQTASRFNVERWPADTATYSWGPDVYSHYGVTWDGSATGATGADVQIQTGRDYRSQTQQGLEIKDTQEPPTDYREKSVDNGTAPDGKGTFPFLHEQTDQD
jgi:sporulation protein YlmC with PRC-barrel domain